MPEAAIDIDGNLVRAEDQVSTRAHPLHRGLVNAKAQASAVKLGTQRNLGPRIPLPQTRHLSTDGGG